METVKTTFGSFQIKKPCGACRSRGVVLPLQDDDDDDDDDDESNEDDDESNDSNTQEDR